MPHITVQHFPKELDAGRRAALVAAVTEAVTAAFEVEEGAVSIALEPVAPDDWQDQVYAPRIVGRADLLVKSPAY
ncbi:tautomerase family protein [Streptomyces griseoviridis]|uniref:Tautomerase family protein n=1 Tax=Streptomyces hintoniae TaxID=3075521 RepID=A0ABU2UBT0_9ACTN|nr:MULTISPECIES: tautomerase family protein [Streptomyces]MDH6695656.1 4-oxalocrotonate tautomerase [Streptomyces sp. MAA16]MDT0470704.1 tautomerase family protein [Streptomyces sp. DSM 41014]